jgi:hypothetical protein
MNTQEIETEIAPDVHVMNGKKVSSTSASHAGMSAMDYMRNLKWSQVAKCLRWLGTLMLVLSAVSFTLGSWLDTSPLFRYFSFSGFTALLCGAGIFCGLRWKEDKGARTFMAVAVSFIPALFAQLGAMMYAEAIAVQEFPEHFSFLKFDPVGVPVLIGNCALGSLVFAVIAYFGFAAMQRKEAIKLTGIYMLSNAILLLPIREGIWVPLIGLGCLIGLWIFDRFTFQKSSHAKTWDGRAMRSLLFVPPVVFIGRSILLPYAVSPYLYGVTYFALFVLFFQVIPSLLPKWAKFCSKLTGLGFLAVSWGCIVIELMESLTAYHDDDYLIPLVVVPVLFGFGILSCFTEGMGPKFRKLIAGALTLACGIQVLVVGGISALLLCAIVGGLLIASAFFVQEKGLILAGCMSIIFGLIDSVNHLLDIYEPNLWIALGILGTVIVLVSSYIERHWHVAIVQVKNFRTQWGRWS